MDAQSPSFAIVYTTGEGLGWHEHDPRLFTAVARFYGTMYRNSMLTEWFPALDGLIEQPETGIFGADGGGNHRGALQNDAARRRRTRISRSRGDALIRRAIRSCHGG